MGNICIYNDIGVSKESLKHTVYTFSKAAKAHNIMLLDAVDISNGDWVSDASLLVMPGGRDLLYCRKLNGKGNDIIKQYVLDGGNYLGICAGSYYGSSFIEFDRGGSLEVIGERELAFFSGKAIGPVIAPYSADNNSGVRVPELLLNDNIFGEKHVVGNSCLLNVYYNGGCYFEISNNCINTRVIASYLVNNLPAVLHTRVGLGNVILSALHFEYDPCLFNKKDVYQDEVKSICLSENYKRLVFIKYILSFFNL